MRKSNTEYLSAKIWGKDRIVLIREFCSKNNMTVHELLESAIDLFFSDKKNMLCLKSKEELIEMILKGETK